MTDVNVSVIVKEGAGGTVSVNELASGAKTKPHRTVSSDTTLDGNDWAVYVDTGSNNVTVSLPPASDHQGRPYNIKKISSLNTMVIEPDGTDTIDGEGKIEITNQYDSITLHSDGSNWFIL